MSYSDSYGPLDQDEIDAQAAALQQRWRENVERSTSVRRSFVHLRQEDATMKAIPRRSRMQTLIQEGRVKEIEFSTRHTVDQMANLLTTNIPTLAGVNPTSITILKSTNRGSEMIRVFRGLTNGYNLNNAFRQRSKKIFIDSGGLLTVTSTTTVASVTPAFTTSSSATSSTITAAVTTPLSAVTSPESSTASSTASSPATQRRVSANPRASGSGQGVRPMYQENSQDVEIVAVRARNQLLSDIVPMKGTTMEISEVIHSGGEVHCRETMEGAEVFDIEGPLQQIQLLHLLMRKNNMSLMLTPCPFTFNQAIIQSHQDFKPIIVLLFDDSDDSVDLIRALNENGDVVRALDSCLVLVANSGSPFVTEMLENVGEDPHNLTGSHILILQRVGLTKRQIVGAWLAGHQIRPDEVVQHVQNVTAMSMQRQMLAETRPPWNEQDIRSQENRDVPWSAAATPLPIAATPSAAGVQSPVSGALGSIVPSASFSQRQQGHISVKLVKPSGIIIMLTVDKRRRVESILTDEDRNAGVEVRMFSGDNISILVPLDSVFQDIVGHDEQVLLRLERK